MKISDDLVKRLRRGVKSSETITLGGEAHDPRMLEAADRIEQLEAELQEARMQSLSHLGQAQDAYEAQTKAEAEKDAAYKRGLENAARIVDVEAELENKHGDSNGHQFSILAAAIRAKIQDND